MRSLADKFGIPLSDSDLAKIGVLAALEAKAKFLILATLKGTGGYNHDQFVALERKQLSDLVAQALEIAPSVDQELQRLLKEFDRRRKVDHEIRHKYVHALWGQGQNDQAVARDVRRAETLTPQDLNEAMMKVAKLAQAAHACAFRVAQLISEGHLADDTESKLKMHIGGRSVGF